VVAAAIVATAVTIKLVDVGRQRADVAARLAQAETEKARAETLANTLASARSPKGKTMLGTSLEVGMGLVLIYGLLGLVTMAVHEGFSMSLRWRARSLRRGIVELFGGGSRAEELTQRVLEHPLIQSLGTGRQMPAYIPPRVFARAFYDALQLGLPTYARS